MTYRLGIDVGSAHTAWATISRDGAEQSSIDGATVESVVAVANGRLLAGADVANTDPSDVQHVTREFVQQLGDPAPRIVGGTPYGVESLIGHLVSSILGTARERNSAEPGAVVLVHDDGLDDYRTGLLTEAARLAGVPLANLVLVSRSDARAATDDPAMDIPAGLELAAGASLVGWALRPDVAAVLPPPTAAGGTLGVATGVATGAATAAAGGAVLGATALGHAAAAAPIAAPAAVTGSALAGTPLTATPPAGPAGTPLTTTPPAGPAGTPLTTTPPAGPAGIPLPGKRPRWVPVAVASTVAVVVAAGVAVAVRSDDDATSAPSATTLVIETSTPEDSAASSPLATAAPSSSAAPTGDETGAACVHGTWTMSNDSFAQLIGAFDTFGEIGEFAVTGTTNVDIAPDGIWTITYSEWTLSATMPDVSAQVTVTIDGVDTTSGEFRDDGTFAFTDISVGAQLSMSATVDGTPIPMPAVPARSVVSGGGSFVCAGDELQLTFPENQGALTMNRTA